MKREDLDCQQRKVVEAVLETDANILVLGGPGSGKTITALWAARTFLESIGPSPKTRVLFLTFSRAAVSQIMSRSPGIISGYEDHIEILTFHAIAYRLIRSLGRYAGYGLVAPSVQSQARVKLLGHDKRLLRYDDLMPGAINILIQSRRMRKLVSSRWDLVICDEVQDTNAKQWELLQLLATRKLLLLGDANQMIYTFIPGVSPERFREIREWAEDEIELGPRSHRDPSGIIPALAEAVRTRQFDHEAVTEALSSDRLTILKDVEDERYQELIIKEIRRSRKLGFRDVGIFAHTNQAVAELADQLDDAGIDHVLVGIPEAHAEALVAMANQCAYAVGLATSEELRQSLALFLTATVRSEWAPVLARSLLGEDELPELVERAINGLEEALTAATIGTAEELVSLAMRSWGHLRIRAGYRPWARAAEHFRRLTRPIIKRSVSVEAIQQLKEIVERTRVGALIDMNYSERGRVKLMNFHQTKGREADTVIHVFRSDDYFGKETEPFEKSSRLLNVAISRARKRVVIILPPDPHPLVEPFSAIVCPQ